MSDIRKAIHDVRNPLNSISMNAEYIKLALDQGLNNDKVVQSVERILEDCKRCSEALNHLKADVQD